MRRCKQCGHKIDSDSAYCKRCGNQLKPVKETVVAATGDGKPMSYCARCGARLPEGAAFCVICGTMAGTNPPLTGEEGERTPTNFSFVPEPDKAEQRRLYSSQWETQDLEPEPEHAHEKKKQKKLSFKGKKPFVAMAMVMVVVLAVSGLGVGAWLFYPVLFPPDTLPADQAALYLLDDNTLRLKLPDREPVTIAGNFSMGDLDAASVARMSGDGRYLAYLDGYDNKTKTGNLYFLDLAKMKRSELQPGRGTLLAEGVTEYFAFSARNTSFVYLTGDGALYGYDFKQEWLLDQEVAAVADVGERQLVYMKNSAPSSGLPVERFDVYLRSIAEDTDDKVLVGQDVSEIIDWSRGYGSFLYTQLRRNDTGGDYTYDITHYDVRQNYRQTLAAGVDVVIDGSAADISAAYLKEKPYTPVYEQFVEDPLAQRDASMLAPMAEDYGLPENYKEIFEPDRDTDDRQREIEEQDKYYDDYQAFLQDTAIYEAKLERDNLRRSVIHSLSSFDQGEVRCYELSLYQNKAARIVEEEIYRFAEGPTLSEMIKGGVQEGSISYLCSNLAAMHKIKLGDLLEQGWDGDNFSVASYLYGNLPQELRYLPLKGSPLVVFRDEGETRVTEWEMAESLGGIYFTYTDRGQEASGGQLYYCPIANGGVEEPMFVDMDVYQISGNQESFGGRTLYLRGDYENTTDLYGVKDGQGQQRIAQGIATLPRFAGVNGGKSLLFYRQDLTGGRRNPGAGGELYLLTPQEERLLIGDVQEYDYRSDKLIFLIRALDRNTGAGELYVYEDGISHVDSGVTVILPLQNTLG